MEILYSTSAEKYLDASANMSRLLKLSQENMGLTV